MANKYMTLDDGKKKLIEATDVSTGAADAGEIVALGSDGKIDPSMLQDIDVSSFPTSEDLSSGDYVNLYDLAGTVTARKADNSNGRAANGYVKESVTAPAAVNVFFESANPGLAGLTPGVRVYLGVNGGVIETPLDENDPVNNGKLHQFLGKAISTTEVNTDIADCIIL